MNKVIILTDSTCDLSEEIIKSRDIKSIPLHVTFPSENIDYLDGVNLHPDDIYKKVEELKETPKTGARSIFEFIKDFTPYIEKGYDIIYTGIGSGLSSTFESAKIAAGEFPEGRIELVDSETLSTGTGLLVLKMCDLRDQGLSAKEIATEVRKLVPKLSVKFCIDTLDYLHKGGRCSGLTKFLGGTLKLHPVAKTTGNKLTVGKICLGKYKKAIDYQIELFKKDLPNIDLTRVFVTDSGRMEGMDEYCIKELSKIVDPSIIIHTRAGCVVTSHCGPKTLGILYILK